MTTHLSPALLRQLSDHIKSAMGLYFPPNRFVDLDRKLRAAAWELAFLDIEAFANWLLSSPLANDQVRMLAGYLTIGETYFYHEPRAWEVLQSEILPSLLASRTGVNQRLRLWSAACSTGEEPYTKLLAEMADLFLQDCDGYLVQIQQEVANGDKQSLMMAAHTLKGSASNFAATPTCAAAMALEKIGRDGNLSHVPRLVHELETALPSLTSTLEQLCQDMAA